MQEQQRQQARPPGAQGAPNYSGPNAPSGSSGGYGYSSGSGIDEDQRRDQNRGQNKGKQGQQANVISQPPWMQAEQISTLEKLEICLYKFVSIFPVFVTFGLFTYLGSFYIICYIVPSLAGNFESQLGIPNLWANQAELEQHQSRAKVQLILFSVFAFMLAISIIQTIRTPPGSIPEDKEWDMQSDSVLESSDDESNSVISESKIDKQQNDPLTNFGIEEDQEEPKEAAHLDYKYLKSFEGPLAKPVPHSNKAESDFEKEKLVKAKKNVPKALFSVERKKFGGIRMCQRCLRTKPDRCHHCSQCNKCVLKMDHHCPWVANCIGFNNYKYFMNMLFYCSITIWLLIWTSYPVASEVMNSETIDYKLAYYIITSYIMGTSFAVIISCFFFFHIWLILRQYTTIEFCEKKREDDATFRISPYNRGKFNNLKSVLGDNILVWFIPFFPNLKGEGLLFEVRDDLKQQLKLF